MGAASTTAISTAPAEIGDAPQGELIADRHAGAGVGHEQRVEPEGGERTQPLVVRAGLEPEHATDLGTAVVAAGEQGSGWRLGVVEDEEVCAGLLGRADGLDARGVESDADGSVARRRHRVGEAVGPGEQHVGAGLHRGRGVRRRDIGDDKQLAHRFGVAHRGEADARVRGPAEVADAAAELAHRDSRSAGRGRPGRRREGVMAERGDAGAGGGTRTLDLLFTKQLLYH